MNALIRLLYAVMVAVSVVTFIGVSVYSLYQPPKMPDYPITSVSQEDDKVFEQQQNEYDKQYKAYDAKQKTYHRNITIVLLPLIVVTVGAGLFVFKKSEVIGEGVTLGGFATSFYATISATIGDARVLRMIAVTLLLATALLIAHRRFSDKKA